MSEGDGNRAKAQDGGWNVRCEIGVMGVSSTDLLAADADARYWACEYSKSVIRRCPGGFCVSERGNK